MMTALAEVRDKLENANLKFESIIELPEKTGDTITESRLPLKGPPDLNTLESHETHHCLQVGSECYRFQIR